MIKIKTGRNIIMSFVLLMSITFTTIVYSAYNTQLQIKGDAILRSIQDIRITKLELVEVTNGAHETYNNKYEKDTTSIYGTLPSNSSLTYQVTITNKGTIDYIVSRVTQLSNSNTNVSVITDLKINDLISKSSAKIFTITLKNTTATTQLISLVNQYKFVKEDEPTITMSDLPVTHTKGNDYSINYTYTVGNSGLKETSCKSNISGSVNNLSILGIGTHTITCTVTANSGKTKSISKSTTITNVSYNITNLVTNGSFEDGVSEWGNADPKIMSSSTEIKKYGDKSFQIDLVNSQLFARKRYTNVETLANHKVYSKVSIMRSDVSLAPGMYVIFSETSEDWPPVISQLSLWGSPNINNWESISVYGESPYNYLIIMLAQGNNQGSGTIYFDGLLFVDLTETFGAGNEPSKEWCDENIEYFDGTTTIYK